MKPLEVKPGIWYRGRAMLNEFGEYQFVPEQTGLREGQIRQIKKTERYTLSHSAKSFIVHMNIPKAKGLVLIKQFMEVVNNVLTDLRTYEV